MEVAVTQQKCLHCGTSCILCSKGRKMINPLLSAEALRVHCGIRVRESDNILLLVTGSPRRHLLRRSHGKCNAWVRAPVPVEQRRPHLRCSSIWDGVATQSRGHPWRSAGANWSWSRYRWVVRRRGVSGVAKSGPRIGVSTGGTGGGGSVRISGWVGFLPPPPPPAG